MGVLDVIPNVVALRSPILQPGLRAWEEFTEPARLYTDDGITPVASDGDAIYRVDDRSDKVLHLRQPTLGNRPLFKTGVAPWTVARFDANDALTSASVTHASNYLTAFIVMSPITIPATGYVWSREGDQALMNVYSGGVDFGSNGDVGYSIWNRGTVLTTGTWYILSLTVDRTLAAGEALGYVNGDHTGSQTSNANNTTQIGTVSHTWSVGHTAVGIACDVSVVAWYDTLLTPTQHNLVGNYLASRHGLSWTTVV